MKIKRCLSRLQCIVLIGLITIASSAEAAIIYVDADSPGFQNGLSWGTAYHYLQDALNLAAPGDEIRVAEGTYKPDEAIGPVTTGRTATFNIPSSITLKGGYAGYGHPAPNTRDISVYETILSGDLNSDDPPVDVNDTAMTRLLLNIVNRQDNSYNVVMIDAVEPNTTVDGFTIMAGNANGPDDWPYYKNTQGGGMWLGRSDILVRKCTFKTNTALDGGGGLYVYDCVPWIDQCNFLGNYANDDGAGMKNASDADGDITFCTFMYNIIKSGSSAGAVYNEYSNPYIADCTFKYNDGGYGGGAIYNYDSEALVEDCLFEANISHYRGGAIINTAQLAGTGITATILRCVFYENEASQLGGAMANYYGTPNIQNCTFEENISHGDGGAMYNRIAEPNITDCYFIGNTATDNGAAMNNNTSSGRIVACKFIANSADDKGGAVYNEASDPNLVNCLFNGNTAADKGGAIATYDTEIQLMNCTFSANSALAGQAVAVLDENLSASAVEVQNCILWDGGNEIYNVDVDSTVSVLYSDVADFWLLGPGNIYTNPLFVDADGADGITGNADDNLRLSSSSPCIDAGNNIGVPPEITTDLDGMARYQDAPLVPNTGVGVPPIDMGAYEFGGSVTPPPPGPPVADAGEDQTVTADPNGWADVILDGSGSYDPNGQPIYHIWQWYIGPQVYYALGENPTIHLPVGTHLIELTVTNGHEWSAPDYVLIEVVEATYYPATLVMWPDTVHRTSGNTYVIADISIIGISKSDVNQSVLPRLYPGGLLPITTPNINDTYGFVRIYAVYSKSQLLAHIPTNGTATITVQGTLMSGQEYQGTDTVQIAP